MVQYVEVGAVVGYTILGLEKKGHLNVEVGEGVGHIILGLDK